MESLLAIANTSAGTSDDASIDAAIGVLRERFDVGLVTTSTPDELDSALSEHRDVAGVAVLGGDGSLHAVVAALHRVDRLPATAVGLVPLGTGNDFARALGLPESPVA